MSSSTLDSLEFSGLPKDLLQSVRKLRVGIRNSRIPPLVSELIAVPNIQSLYLDFGESCETDYLLYQAIQSLTHLKELEIHYYAMSSIGALELTNIFSLQLESLTLRCYGYPLLLTDPVLNRPIEAALSCHTLKKLMLNGIQFHTVQTPTASNVETIECDAYDKVLGFTVERLADCLFSFANMCKMASIKSASMIVKFMGSGWVITNVPPEILCHFIAILNNAFHCNPSLAKLHVFLHMACPVHFSLLSRLLRKEPEVLLKRSRSLRSFSAVDINRTETAEHYWLEDGIEETQCQRSSSGNSARCPSSVTAARHSFHEALWRSRSCPDLLEMQAVHSMHPLVHDFLRDNGYKTYYCGKSDNWHRNRSSFYHFNVIH